MTATKISFHLTLFVRQKPSRSDADDDTQVGGLTSRDLPADVLLPGPGDEVDVFDLEGAMEPPKDEYGGWSAAVVDVRTWSGDLTTVQVSLRMDVVDERQADVVADWLVAHGWDDWFRKAD